MSVITLPKPPSLVVSLVSHGHGHMVQLLLLQLARLSAASITRVVLTQNLPEPEPVPPACGWPFELLLIVNETPRGFGPNHNRALENAGEAFVSVLNPDVSMLGDVDIFNAMVDACIGPGIGCAYPLQVDSKGCIQSSEREIPTPHALWRRRLMGRREVRVDWVNAACLVLPLAIWRELGGFDERYFMYCEDVDLCLRMHLRKLRLVRVPVQIIHAGNRASSRRIKHLSWHVASLWRLWRSDTYKQAKEMLY